MAPSETARLLRSPRYARYIAVVSASRAVSTMFNVAAVLLVLDRTGSLSLAGLVVAAATLPGALTGPFLGAWLDVTSSRRRLLVLDRLLTIISLGALIALTGHAPDWTLPLVAVLYGVTSPLASGAFSSVLPEIVGPELMDIGYTFDASSLNTAFILGPALAGALVGVAGAAAALEAQMAAVAVLALLIGLDPTFELRPRRTDAAPDGLREAVRVGLAAMWRIAPLRWNVLAGVIYVAGWGMLNVAFPAYAVSVGAPAHTSGYMWAAVSAGSLVSAFAFRGPATRIAPAMLTCGSFLSMAASVALWPLAGGLAGALALITLTGLLEGPSLVALMSVHRRLAPPHTRGQIFATVASLNLAASALGSVIAGPLQSAVGTDATLIGFAALMAIAGVVSLGTAARTPSAATKHS